MNPLHLKQDKTVKAKQVAPVETDHVATSARIVDLNIDLLQNLQGSADVVYELGNMVAGEFVPLPVEESKRQNDIVISGELFAQVAHTPIAPSEKAMTPYDILRTRLEALMRASDIINGEE